MYRLHFELRFDSGRVTHCFVNHTGEPIVKMIFPPPALGYVFCFFLKQGFICSSRLFGEQLVIEVKSV